MEKDKDKHLATNVSHLTLYVDGAARGNPGPAGVGIYIKSDSKDILKEKEYIGERTNNEAEYIALILGLEKAAGFGKKIQVFSDSELLVNQVRSEFKVKQVHLKSLLEKVRQIQGRFESFDICHSSRDNNQEADRLANEAIDEFLKGERKQIEIDYLKQEKLF